MPVDPAYSIISPEQVKSWCHEVSPRQEKTIFELKYRINGIEGRITSGGADERIYNVGCFQEAMLAFITCDLVEAGKIAMNDMVGDYLTELNKGKNPGGKIRIADLLCHASGLRVPHMGQIRYYKSWSDLCEFLISHDLRFPAGAVSDYVIVERILLIKILEIVLQQSPYKVLEDRFTAGLDAGFLSNPYLDNLGLKDFFCDLSDLEKIWLQLLHGNSWFKQAVSMPILGSVQIFDSTLIGKSFVATAISLGLIGFGAGLWGINGSGAESSASFRFDEQQRVEIKGIFRSNLERELIMNELCERFGLVEPGRSQTRAIGSLRGFRAEDLAGVYEAGNKVPMIVSCSGSDLVFQSEGVNSSFRVGIEGDYLKSYTKFPGLWIEPFRHPETSVPCIMIGKSASVRVA